MNTDSPTPGGQSRGRSSTVRTTTSPTLTFPTYGRPGGAADVIGEQTRAQVFAALLSGGPLSRTQLAQRTGLSASSVTKVVTPLLESDYVLEVGVAPAEGGAGRPQRMLAVNPERHAVVGVKLHPSHVTAVVTDMAARVTARGSRKLRGSRPELVLAAATELVAELLSGRGPDVPTVLGLGVGVGGHVDTAAGVCVRSGVLGWESVDIAGPLAKSTGLGTVVSNDLSTLVVAQHWFGKGRDTASFAVVSVGAGIGSGLMIGGNLHTGTSGTAGELGHIPLSPRGPKCTCGNRGCLEAVASTGAILRGIEERGGPKCKTLTQAMRLAHDDHGAGGSAAKAAFEHTGEALGRGLATLCNLLNLEKIILSGEGAVAYDLFGPSLQAAWRAHSFSTAAQDCELIIDVVDDDLWARGAACLVIQAAVGVSPASR